MNCGRPSTFCTRRPYHHNTLNQVICIYLLEEFLFVFRWLTLFTFSIQANFKAWAAWQVSSNMARQHFEMFP